MWNMILLLSIALWGAVAVPQEFETMKFRVGIEYEHSLPMYGGSDRYRHRNNCDPFFVTITASAKKNFVIAYLEVTATVDAGGEVDFNLIRGQTGSTNMVFQLVSNHSDFLAYSYMTYGIREEEYKKISNIISFPMPNNGIKERLDLITIVTFIALYSLLSKS